MRTLAETVVSFLKDYLPAELVVFVVSMLPFLELRGGLIAASLLGIDFVPAFIICVIGNMLPIPFVMFFMRKILNLLRKIKFFQKIITKIDGKIAKNSEKVLGYKRFGLFAFVAIPLPGTGAWMGALVADALDLRFRDSFPLITAGVITAGLIVSLISYAIPAFIA